MVYKLVDVRLFSNFMNMKLMEVEIYSNDRLQQLETIALAGCNNTLISIWIVDQPHSITKCCIACTVGEYHLFRPIRKRDFFPAICIVVLNLFVWEVKRI